jgi:alpha-tubulin suppressor-like RCC1 family protein
MITDCRSTRFTNFSRAPHLRAGRVALVLASLLGVWLHPLQATPPPSYTGVFGWGANDVGQLGHNSTSAYRVPATTELYGKTIVAVTAGDSHSLALDSNGVLYSWGSNSDGQLGNNSTTSSSVPIVVNTTSGVSALHGKTVVAIAAGIKFSMALASDGTVATWGADEGWGKLGNGSSEARSVPVAVSTSGALAGKTITAIAAGQDHCLALASDGTLYAWGCSHHGRLGSNVYFNPSTPVAVPMTGVLAGKTIVRIAAGAGHGLALASDGVLVGWGLNYNGEVDPADWTVGT